MNETKTQAVDSSKQAIPSAAASDQPTRENAGREAAGREAAARERKAFDKSFWPEDPRRCGHEQAQKQAKRERGAISLSGMCLCLFSITPTRATCPYTSNMFYIVLIFKGIGAHGVLRQEPIEGVLLRRI